ncbi:Fringe-like protein [Niveomyces insectorum RCEF 264]|uniref:Fringe-like protein n=1 Tax=Niveomyces insectorum RCEF 264 TaxID=1081102 RepID=A0A167UNP7_9HYPO|nr:Fringe-like protein [Niveomyces insectorum RCEF 264]
MLCVSRRFLRGRPLLVIVFFLTVCLVSLLQFRDAVVGAANQPGTFRTAPSDKPAAEDASPNHTQPATEETAAAATVVAGTPAAATAAAASVCPPALAHLRGRGWDLTPTIRYSRRCVRPTFDDNIARGANHRHKVTKVPRPLLPEPITINLTAGGADAAEQQQHAPVVDLPPCQPLVLRVPPPYPPHATFPHLLFGVSSTHARLLHALDGFAHWLDGAGVQLVALVQDAEGEETAAAAAATGGGTGAGGAHVEPKDLHALMMAYRARGIQLRAQAPRNRSLTVAQNHFAVIEALLAVATPQTRWLGIVDDDTFFPSLYKLDRALQAYDPQKPTWLGALSEDFDAISLFGYMAYGGAGVFLSVPLARQLAPHLQACLQASTDPAATTTIAAKLEVGQAKVVGSSSRGGAGKSDNTAGAKMPTPAIATATGDGILRDCIYAHTATKLTVVPGLYQHDMYGELDGFYEAGVLPLSVHHWRSWYKAPLPAMAAVTARCGDCFLQRWQFGGDTLLANGFSITRYPGGLAPVDLAQMEATWSHAGREFDFSLGPLRRPLGPEAKKSYRLRDAARDPHGGGEGGDALRQTYIYKGDFMQDEPDEVFELIWEAAAAIE